MAGSGSDDGVESVLAPTPLDRVRAWFGEPRSYRLTRSLVLRLLGVVYLFAFLGMAFQAVPLLGEHGLTPIARYLEALAASPRDAGFIDVPTIFWIDASDSTLVATAWFGVALSVAVIAGYANSIVMLVLWILYGSFVHVGQLWFAFGWESQLLETGFLAIFLAPGLDPRPLASRPPPLVLIILFRWLAFRIMLGAGLIKLRGDPCWTQLTCLDTHFETQPVPNPLSPWLHHMPHWVHAAGVLFNHVAELVAPWFILLGSRRTRLIGAVIMTLFQLSLIVSGNLSFLNWLTLIPVVACFDDDALRRLLPRRLRVWVDRRTARADADGRDRPTAAARVVTTALAILIAVKSIEPIANLLSKHQIMNTTFDRFALVNTYGAFGSVDTIRHQLVIEGTRDAAPGADTVWLAYELPCMPGDLDRRPCLLGPYHYRLDWLLWFAAMVPSIHDEPWVGRVVAKLLRGDPGIRSLFAVDPFGDQPPRWIRIRRFQYHFADGGEAWWVRDHEESWLDPVSLDDLQ